MCSERLIMRRRLAIGAAVVTAALVITGCNANPSTPTNNSSAPPTKGGTLNILSSGTEMNFDPATSQSLAITSNGLVNRRLTAWQNGPGKPATVVPDLAGSTGKSSDGGKTWTYTLKS